jgi:hypothetical protein
MISTARTIEKQRSNWKIRKANKGNLCAHRYGDESYSVQAKAHGSYNKD